MEVVSLLSLIEGFDFRLGRRNVRVRSPKLMESFFYKSFFRILVDPSPTVELVFDKVRLFA